MKLVTVFLGLLFSVTAMAADPNLGFEKIKNKGRYYKDPGAVCEEIARVEFQAMYPASEYEVIVGIAYNSNGRTLGELDLVLLNKKTDRVEMVGEVKCYTNLQSGLGKAKQQRRRFLSNLSSNRNLKFVNTTTGEVYERSQFDGVREFISVAQKGGLGAGFDYEMEYDLDEMSQIRDMMIECQRKQLCPLK